MRDLYVCGGDARDSSCTYVSSIVYNTPLLRICADARSVQIGPYYVQNCNSNSNDIAPSINALKDVLQPVLADLSSSRSSKAYTTFFKHSLYAPYVRDVFSNVTKGASVPSEPRRASKPPILYCVDGRNQVTFNESHSNTEVDAFTRCRTYIGIPSIALLGTPYIVICPAFFDHPVVPTKSPANCFSIDPQLDRYALDGRSSIKYQVWHIMHELVHYYVYSTKQKRVDVYAVNACVNLPGGYAVLNPQSYTYYAASKRMIQLLFFCCPYTQLIDCGRYMVGVRELPNREDSATWPPCWHWAVGGGCEYNSF